MTIELRRYEKPLKRGGYYARTVSAVTPEEVFYRFETENDGYQIGCATRKAFQRWMRGCLPVKGGPHA